MKIKLTIILIFGLFGFMLLEINGKSHEKYLSLYEEKANIIVSGKTALRGRILDRNGKVLVDNVGVLNIIYHKSPDITIEEELETASILSNYITEYNLSDDMKKNYYLLLHDDGSSLLTDEEKEEYNERKITKEELEERKKMRIKEEDITYNIEEEKKIYVYSLMNSGYYYEDKYILKDIDRETSIKIMEQNLKGISTNITSKRVYPYGETLKGILGSIGSIPKEETNYYIENNYSLDDTVGISGLEKTYEKELKGEKGKYLVNSDYSLTQIEEEKKGNDIYLNIDIDLQLLLEDTLKTELINARKKKQSKYFYNAYSIIGEPSTGSILAISGINLGDDKNFSDITPTVLTSSFVMGSVVKGASSSVGYLTNSITVGKKILDSCVKLYSEPSKCSYKRLGYVDDITALKTSSNYFQFYTAIKTTGQQYKYNMKFNVTLDDFERYRSIFREYGLGSKTEIDLPNEKLGMIGNKVSGDLLLNLAIGQYDTYTPIELFQYINTIATKGNRYKLRIANVLEPTLLNHTSLGPEYFERILEGFYQVFHGGTASSYANKSLEVSGKTGTSETFYDKDHDGVMDTKTINSTLALFYPRTEPKYSMIIIAPNITDSDTYTYPFTKNVSLKMTNYLSGLNNS